MNKPTIKIGDTFNHRNYRIKYHVLAVLDDEPETQVVLKYYGNHKQWWHYKIEALEVIETWLDVGLYTNYRKRREIWK